MTFFLSSSMSSRSSSRLDCSQHRLHQHHDLLMLWHVTQQLQSHCLTTGRTVIVLQCTLPYSSQGLAIVWHIGHASKLDKWDPDTHDWSKKQPRKGISAAGMLKKPQSRTWGLTVAGEADLEQQVPVDKPCRVPETNQLQQLGQLQPKSTRSQCRSAQGRRVLAQ